MSLFQDSPIVSTGCKQHKKKHSGDTTATGNISPLRSLLKYASVPSLSSIVARAGCELNHYRGGLSKEEREEKLQREVKKRVLQLGVRNATSFDEWYGNACGLDELEDNNTWKSAFESDDYDPCLVQSRLLQLEDARISCDVARMLFLIRTALSRDLGHMSNANLYRHSHVGTKNLIDQYISTALDTLSTLLDVLERSRCDGREMKFVLEQLLSARQAFGRSALLLSGGATFGMNHIGVVKALWEANLLPRIVSGSSAGSIVCAVLCIHTDDEMPDIISEFGNGDFSVFGPDQDEDNALKKTARFLKTGSFFDISHLTRVMKELLGDMTFQEAYNRTRRILNICVSSAGLYELPRLLNYITAPNVLIWSAVATSCSVPFIFSASSLMAKDPLTGEAVPWNQSPQQWIDGSVDNDLPMTRLSEMFNVNHFIVSQVNPHVIPFIYKEEEYKVSDPGSQSLLSSRWFHTISGLARDEALFRMNVLSDLGFFPNTLTKMISIMSQKYSGDINILPEISYTDFPRMLKNPTTDFMRNACLSGERATWPKLGRVRNHCAIELALDSAVQTMRARVAFSPSQVDLRMTNFHSTFGKPGRVGRVRRRSHGSESNRVKADKHHGTHPHIAHLHRSRSTVFMVEPKHSEQHSKLHDLAGDFQTSSISNRTDNPSLGVSFVVGSDSEEDLQAAEANTGLDGTSWATGSYVSISPGSTRAKTTQHRASVGKIATTQDNTNRFSSSKARPASLSLTPSPSLMMTPQSPPVSPTQQRASPVHTLKRQSSHRRFLGHSLDSN
ncbi:hypothetical protein FQN54_001888 [Arachnomyces sp. PD_36]|nr:hypothetical protein FQN54_001888 [Arachnomyces sp. PD_36]